MTDKSTVGDIVCGQARRTLDDAENAVIVNGECSYSTIMSQTFLCLLQCLT